MNEYVAKLNGRVIGEPVPSMEEALAIISDATASIRRISGDMFGGVFLDEGKLVVWYTHDPVMDIFSVGMRVSNVSA